MGGVSINWLDFFFGWLTKGQAEISMLDGIMFWIEVILVLVVIFWILVIKQK